MPKWIRAHHGGWMLCLLIAVVIATTAVSVTNVQGEITSKNNPLLKAALKKYPAADLNKDGVLTGSEASAYMARLSDRGKTRNKDSKDIKTVRKTARDGTITITNAKYGQHERHIMDLWLPKSDKPTAIVMYIHGGGFMFGDKLRGHRQPLRTKCLGAKVAFATMNYRFLKHASYEEIMHDGARAIQTLRANAKKWNIDPKRIGVYGSSAGATMSLWLGFHPDVSKKNSKDRVEQYSSKVSVVGGLRTPVGTDSLALKYASKGDPPVFQYNPTHSSRTSNLHHPRYAQAVEKKCKQLQIQSVMILRNSPKPLAGNPVGEQVKFFFKYLRITDQNEKKTDGKSGKKTDD
ncbi:MAG: alpha/beta hydrolase [bacterium]|nr:alpha/beta hydrolase [bacterium]